MASGAGKGNFSSKFLNLIGGKKKPKAKYGSTGSVGSGDSDEDGYMDPEGLCPTEPPREAMKPPVPDYPPPYCPASKSPNPSMRPFSSIEYGNVASSQMRDHARTMDSVNRGLKPAVAEKPKAVTTPRVDDYSDPWDSKAKSLDLSNRPAKPLAKPTASHPPRPADNYMDPYDSKKAGKPPVNLNAKRDNYVEPWDSRSKPRDVKKNHKDDYKDPWDTKIPASLPKSSYEEDEDYTVPYDAGPKTIGNGVRPTATPSAPVQEDIYDMTYEDQMAAARARIEADRKNSRDQQQKKTVPKFVQEDNYEEPWEYKAKSYPKTTPKAPSPSTHAPKVPNPSSHPKPPSDDYDAPWEWNQNSLTKAMANLPPPTAKQSEVTRDRVESSLNNENRPIVKPNHRQQSKESVPVEENHNNERIYEVDPTIPLEHQNWYHGKISRLEAESLLRGLPDCSYLIRDSESSKTDFSLSVRNHNEPMHLKISCRQGKFILGQNSRPYDTIPEMIQHYSMNKLNIKGAEQVKLIYPVIQEAMYFTVEPGS